MKTEKQKAQEGQLYDANYDKELLEERAKCKVACQEYNKLSPLDTKGRERLIRKILGSTGERFCIEQPFYCDYGYNIEIGEDFYSNIGCVILDGAKVKFGRNVFVAPYCGFYTAEHPLNVEQRTAGLEYARPITVGDNVWIGGHVCVLPGVTIGDNAVIGAGSVVNRDIPTNVVAAGNPCRVIRSLTNKEEKKMKKTTIMGAIAGDVIGSIYEFHPTKNKDFKLFRTFQNFTDDTVMTIAVADWILTGNSLTHTMQDYGCRYPDAGYGGGFRNWLKDKDPQPYNSWGNGSAMRVSAVGFAYDTLDEVLKKAKESAEVTHNHPEGIKGAQATAAAIFLARTGSSKQKIKEYIESTFGYNLGQTCDEIRPYYQFDVSCQGSVPESIICFLESTDYEDAIRLAISMGGDADTMGAITGGIAIAYYKKMPKEIYDYAMSKLPDDMKDVVERFEIRFNGAA